MLTSCSRALTLSVIAGLASSASAQTVWTGGGTSNWATAANWTAGVPTSAVSAIIAAPPSATLSAAGATNDLTLQNATAGVAINGGATLTVSGASVSNAGTIVVNANGSASDAFLTFGAAATTLSGSGAIVLNPLGTVAGADAGLTTSVASNVVTNAAGHTIRGNGFILANVSNNGLITADTAGALLRLEGSPKSNAGQIIAQNGGIIDSGGTTITQTPTGVIRATGAGSIAEIGAASTLVGGTWEGVSGGLARTGGSLVLDGVTTSGTVHVISSHVVSVLNGLSNAGTITVNPGAGSSDATMLFNSPSSTISGSGSIVLNPTGVTGFDAGLTSNVATNQVTNSATHSIRGNGYILLNMINDGLVTAEAPGQLLRLETNPKFNTGDIVAQGGGVVDINGITVTQSAGGLILATGAGSIVEASGGIAGGTLESAAGGLVRTGGSLTLDGVTLGGSVDVASGDTLAVTTAIANTGAITVNPSGGASDATISFNSPALTLAGGGTIILNPTGAGVGVDAGLVSNAPANVVTNPAGATIRGNGYVNVNVANAGVVAADIPARTLNLGVNPKSNSGLMLAQSGGTLDIGGVTITQTGAGTIRADGAGSAIELTGAVLGGALEATNGGVVRTVGAVTLDSVALAGPVNVQSASVIIASGTLASNGVITINSTGGSTNASLNIANSMTLQGAGSIVLNGVVSPNDAVLGGNGAATLTLPQTQTITGNGTINVNITNAGTLSPGQPSGDRTQAFVRSAPIDIVCTPTSVVNIDLEGITAAQHDRIFSANSAADFHCAGTLNVQHINGFAGAPVGTLLDLITTTAPATVTGTFATTNVPTLPGDNRYVVLYGPQRVALYATCYANCDASTVSPVLNVLDFSCFLTKFQANDPYANCDGSTVLPTLNVLDFSCFLSKFRAGCV